MSLIRRLHFVTSKLVNIEQMPSKREMIGTTVRFAFALACIAICAFAYTPNIARKRFHGRLFVTLLHRGQRPVAVPIRAMGVSSTDGAQAIISPFDTMRRSPAVQDDDKDGDTAAKDTSTEPGEEESLALTLENVELVLDSMRPYLKADGGNVRLAGIDGPVVKLELEGACGTCPSSAMTMKMGLERKLKQRIPEITDVIQSMPRAPTLDEANIETVLAGVRPFLAVAGGTIQLHHIDGAGAMQPSVVLDLQGTAAALQSVKSEIQQRIQRHFMASVRVEWKS